MKRILLALAAATLALPVLAQARREPDPRQPRAAQGDQRRADVRRALQRQPQEQMSVQPVERHLSPQERALLREQLRHASMQRRGEAGAR